MQTRGRITFAVQREPGFANRPVLRSQPNQAKGLMRRGQSHRVGRVLSAGKQLQRTHFLPFSRPSITDAELQSVAEVLRSGWITTGRKTAEFEERFRAYTGCK